MNLIMKDIFEMPNRILAERNYIQRSVVETYVHRLLLLKYSRTEKYEPNIRNEFPDINNQLDQMEE